MNLLIIGGSSFIGKHCIAELIKSNYQVRTTIRDINRSDEIKLEIEHYNQISDIVGNSDLSRFEMLIEVYWPIYENWRVVLGYETEQFDYSDNTTNSSKYISIAYHDFFDMINFKERLF